MCYELPGLPYHFSEPSAAPAVCQAQSTTGIADGEMKKAEEYTEGGCYIIPL